MVLLSRFNAPRLALAGLAVAALVGCKKPTVQVYLAPRDASPEVAAKAQEPLPELTWTLPSGWKETGPGQMSLATFAVEDANGTATMNVTPLPNLEGREEAVVNMWREQVELGPLSSEEVAKALEPTEIAGGKGFTFEIKGSRGGKPARILTAVQHRDDRSWFFKLSGDETTVAAQKPAFLKFLKSLRFNQAAPEGASAGPASNVASSSSPDQTGSPQFQWKIPDAWQKLPAGQMQVAKFSVPSKDGAKAEVSVSVFPSDTGGTLANVNRWRRQIGLSEVDESGLQSCIAGLDASPGAVLVNLTNEQRQLLGAIVPRQGKWWFYKMLGDAPAVASAHEDFLRFVQTAP
jgi:VCBS repeat-containing protein